MGYVPAKNLPDRAFFPGAFLFCRGMAIAPVNNLKF
jgi:hypothetical protein